MPRQRQKGTATARRRVIYRWVLAGLIGALVMSVGGVYTAIQADDLNPQGGPESIRLGVNSFVQDGDVTLERLGILINGAATSASGGSAPGVEASSSLPAVNNALIVNNYAYQFRVKESSATAWQSGESFKVRVYGYDSAGPTTTLLSTLYLQQSIVDDGNVEGVTVTIDLGLSAGIHDQFNIIVERQ